MVDNTFLLAVKLHSLKDGCNTNFQIMNDYADLYMFWPRPFPLQRVRFRSFNFKGNPYRREFPECLMASNNYHLFSRL